MPNIAIHKQYYCNGVVLPTETNRHRLPKLDGCIDIVQFEL